MTKKPMFDYELCMACGLCFQACPVSCLELKTIESKRDKKAYPAIVGDSCNGCGICVKICPDDVVSIKEG